MCQSLASLIDFHPHICLAISRNVFVFFYLSRLNDENRQLCLLACFKFQNIQFKNKEIITL
jgi:hypothetical protein